MFLLFDRRMNSYLLHPVLVLLTFMTISVTYVSKCFADSFWLDEKPRIIVVEGISLTGAIFGSILDGYLTMPRTEQYIYGYLKAQWVDTDIVEIPWSGELSDISTLATYTKAIKVKITQHARLYPTVPLVVVGHSWGSVIAYQVLRELESSGIKVASFITLGSPLATKSLTLKTALTAYIKTHGNIPGQQYVFSTTPLKKPSSVVRWTNFWNRNDKISGKQSDSNGTNAVDREVVYVASTARAHAAYYVYEPFTSLIGESIVSDLGGRSCKDLYSRSTAVPAGYGAAYNIFSSSKEVVLRASCGTSDALATIGSGLATQLIWKEGYENVDGRWLPITLSGPKAAGNGWFEGVAQGVISKSISGARNTFLAYTCTKVSGQWKCGCRDATCSSSLWELQAFVPRSTSGSW